MQLNEDRPNVLGPSAATKGSRLPVATLLGHSHVSMALHCLGTLRRQCQDDIDLLVFSDGSLTPDDISEVEVTLDARVVSREEADDVVLPLVRNHPAAAAYRREHVFATKLIDVPMYIAATSLPGSPTSDDYAFVDTDILFTRPFRGFDRRGMRGIVMMRDVNDMVSIDPYDRNLARYKIRLAERANSGFVFVGGGVYELDFVEAFLREPAYRWDLCPQLVEQTAWSAHAVRSGGSYWNRAQVVVPDGNVADHIREAVAVHFYTGFRDKLAEGMNALMEGLPVETLLTEPLEVRPVWEVAARRIAYRASNFAKYVVASRKTTL